MARTGAPVLLAWISGTPPTRDMNTALRSTSNSRVVFIGRYDFAGERDPEAITRRLREEIRRVSRWQLNDEMLPMGEPVVAGGRSLLADS